MIKLGLQLGSLNELTKYDDFVRIIFLGSANICEIMLFLSMSFKEAKWASAAVFFYILQITLMGYKSIVCVGVFVLLPQLYLAGGQWSPKPTGHSFFFLWIFIQLFAQIKLNPHSSSPLMPSPISNGRSGLWRGPVEQPRSGLGCWLQPAQQSLL